MSLAIDSGEVRLGTATGDDILVAETGHPATFVSARASAWLGVGSSAEVKPNAVTDWYVPPDTESVTAFTVTIAVA
jgi:hypothetical protein